MKRSTVTETLARSNDAFDEMRVLENAKELISDACTLQELRSQFAKAIYVIQNVPVMSLVLDLNRTVLWISDPTTHILGKSTEDLVGKQFQDVINLNFNEIYYRTIWETALEFGFWQGQIEYKDTMGKVTQQWLKLFSLPQTDGKLSHIGAILFDLSESIQMQSDLHRVSYFDHMTELPNYRSLRQDMRNAIDNKHATQNFTYFIMIRLSNLSEINVLHGVSVGDAIIMDVVKRLRNILLPNCKLYRIVGDIFGIVATGILNQETYNRRLVVIKEALNVPFVIYDKSISLSSNFGVSIYPLDADDYEVLLQNAEMAMRVSQERNSGINFYSTEMNVQYTRSLVIMDKLQEALENNIVQVHYQPVINTKTRKVAAVESLLRWTDDELGYVPPNEIIEYAELHQFMPELGLWIIEEVFKSQLDKRVFVSINVSLSQVEHPFFIEKLRSLVEKYAIDAEKIIFEITEHKGFEDSKVATESLDAIRELGFKIALDDFGIGYSSLTLLNQFPSDVLKLDRSFITGMTHETKQGKISKSVIEMAHNLGLLTVCEGIETSDDVSFAQSLSCDYLQGFYYSKAIPKHELEHFIQEHEKDIIE